jgi:hypothetical protein
MYLLHRPGPDRTGTSRALATWVLAWLAILPVAVTNGVFRETVLRPRLSERVAQLVSAAMLSSVIAAFAARVVRTGGGWMTPRDALAGGGLWAAMTAAFDLLFGRYRRGLTGAELLADYDVTKGRSWPLVLLTEIVAPPLLARRRR